ncbi:uncharacterized protein LOC127280397 [Leptopilina boulardi]|uniref:uncharacterized protein LOC127280397 n=1 Tax=Leptopilina boulardi TaxID=63433 RepID=UPI0021F5B876|nr:uncharacterized protein LOC127280397 [Leptopilina boulardi]
MKITPLMTKVRLKHKVLQDDGETCSSRKTSAAVQCVSSLRIIFWNVRGLSNLDDILDHTSDSDIICLSETWATSTTPLTGYLQNPDLHLISSLAKKKHVKGHAKGGLLVISNKRKYKMQLISDRSSVDVNVDKRGELITECFEELGMFVLNGRTKNDSPS